TDILIEGLVPRLVVSGIHQRPLTGFHTETHAALGMIQPHRPDGDAAYLRAAGFEVVEMPLSLHLTHVYRNIRGGHLLFHDLLQTAGPAGGMEEKLVTGVVVQRTEKRNPLNMVPMKMRDKDMCRNWLPVTLGTELSTEGAQAGTTIENVERTPTA